MRVPALALVTVLCGCVVVREDECDVDADCGPAGLCDVDECESIYDRWWEVTALAASVGAVHPDGAAWDPDGGAPDLLLSFGRFTDDSCVTPTAIDAWSAEWDHFCEFYVGPQDALFVEVYDEDAEGYDLGASFAFSGDEDLGRLARTRGSPYALIDDSDTVSASVAVRVLGI